MVVNLDYNIMDINSLIRQIADGINENRNHKIPYSLINEAFYYCVFDWNRWQLLSRQDPIYIIGLSEAKYDYYWVYVTNKDHEIHFASCALDVSLESKFRKYTFNKGELRDIRKTMIEYFQNHPEETLIISKFNENPEEEDYYIENVY